MHYRDLFPVLAPILVMATQVAYSAVVFSNPFQYAHEKTTWFQGLGIRSPWETISRSERVIRVFIHNVNLKSLNTGFSAIALFFIIIGCIFLWKRKLYLEAGYVTLAAFLITLTGSSWGAGRFSVVLFPIFIIMARHFSKNIWQWRLYFLISISWQVILLYNYVNFRPPSP